MHREVPILLVEDDNNDVFFLKYAFEAAGILNPLQVVGDGREAVDYLAGAGRYADRTRYPFPSILLLDLKLPVQMGQDVLRWIGRQPGMETLLVIVLSSSSDPVDIDECYRLGARSYLVKPLSLDKRIEVAKAFRDYWLQLNEFPTSGFASRG
jgi:CheY-like chemotaxis protein